MRKTITITKSITVNEPIPVGAEEIAKSLEVATRREATEWITELLTNLHEWDYAHVKRFVDENPGK
jgi:hypothetical protein